MVPNVTSISDIFIQFIHCCKIYHYYVVRLLLQTMHMKSFQFQICFKAIFTADIILGQWLSSIMLLFIQGSRYHTCHISWPFLRTSILPLLSAEVFMVTTSYQPLPPVCCGHTSHTSHKTIRHDIHALALVFTFIQIDTAECSLTSLLILY